MVRLLRPPWARLLLVGGAYLLLSLLFTWPMALHFNSAVLGGRVATHDHGLYIWQLWWLKYALQHGMSPMVCPMVYYPDPVQFYVQPFHLAASALAAPALFGWGPYAAYNTAALASFALSGLGAYLLLRHLDVRPWLAFLGGALFAFAPFHAVKYADGHLNLMQTQWVPFYLLALLQLIARPSWQALGLTVLCAALNVLSDLYWALNAALFTVLLFALLLLRMPSRRQALRLLALPLAIGLGLGLILLPFWVGAFQNVAAGGRSGLALSIRLYSADLLDFFTPNLLHPVWGAWALQWGARWHPSSAGGNVGLGLVLLATIGVAMGLELARWGKRTQAGVRGQEAGIPKDDTDLWAIGYRLSAISQPALWLALLVGMLVLCLGPELKVAGFNTGIPLPYAIIEQLPGASVGRKPNHAVLLVILCAVVLFGLLGERALRHGFAWARPLLVLAALVALVEYLPPRWQIFPQLPRSPFLTSLAAAAEKEALLNLPRDSHTSVYLRHATQHEWPIVGGSISRKPYDWLSDFAPGVRQLTNAALDPPDVLDPPLEQVAVVSLDAYGLRYIVVHRDSSQLPPDYLPRVDVLLREWLGPEALVAREGAMEIYQVPQIERPPPFAYFREGWYGVERQQGRRWRWSQGQAEVLLVNPREHDLPVVLTIEGESPAESTTLRLRLDGALLAELRMPRQRSRHNLRLLLRPGQHLLSLESPSMLSQEKTPRPLGIALTALRIRATQD